MQKLSDLNRFQEHKNIVLKGFDPVSAAGFTQVPNFILRNRDLSSNARLVYAQLLSYAWHNKHVFPGQERMAAEIGLTKPTVNRAIAELKEAGFLSVQRRGQGKTNIYTLYHTVKDKRRGRR